MVLIIIIIIIIMMIIIIVIVIVINCLSQSGDFSDGSTAGSLRFG